MEVHGIGKRVRLGLTLFGLLFASTYLPGAAGALSVSTLRTDSRVLARDASATRPRYSNAQILTWLNEGQRQAATEAKPIRKSAEFELTVGGTYYSFPSDFLQLDRLSHDHEVLPEITPEALDRAQNWFETGAEPTHYYLHFASRTKVAFYPWPDSSSSTGTIRYTYFAQATDLSADSDTPYNGITELIPYHYGLAYYAAARMCALDGRMDLAALYLAEWRMSLEALKREANARPSYRPAAIGGRRE